MPSKLKLFCFNLSKRQREQLRLLSALNGVTQGQYLRNAIDRIAKEHINRGEQRVSLIQECDNLLAELKGDQ